MQTATLRTMMYEKKRPKTVILDEAKDLNRFTAGSPACVDGPTLRRHTCLFPMLILPATPPTLLRCSPAAASCLPRPRTTTTPRAPHPALAPAQRVRSPLPH